MKILIIFIVINGAVFGENELVLQKETINRVKNLLSIHSPLSDKAKGICIAKQYDVPEVNDSLVELLKNDESLGGRISRDEGIEKPWVETIHLLAMRFPEAEVKINVDYKYTISDKANFLKWWVENKVRIEYYNNTHVLTGH